MRVRANVRSPCYHGPMTTGRDISKKMHEYEAKVLTALGFAPDDPVVLRECSPDDFLVTFEWFSNKALPGPVANASIYRIESDGPIEYQVMVTDLPTDVWLAIVKARREWESNFPTVRHG